MVLEDPVVVLDGCDEVVEDGAEVLEGAEVLAGGVEVVVTGGACVVTVCLVAASLPPHAARMIASKLVAATASGSGCRSLSLVVPTPLLTYRRATTVPVSPHACPRGREDAPPSGV